MSTAQAKRRALISTMALVLLTIVVATVVAAGTARSYVASQVDAIAQPGPR